MTSPQDVPQEVKPPHYRARFIHAVTKVLSDKDHVVRAIVSTDRKDRDGDIIDQAFWGLENFGAYAPLLSSHNYGSLERLMGSWPIMGVVEGKLIGEAHYLVGKGNKEVDWAWELVKSGLGAFSVGFIPDYAKAEVIDGTEDSWFPNYTFKGQELLEVSQVTVPSNADALAAIKAAGGLHPDLEAIVTTILKNGGRVETRDQLAGEGIDPTILNRISDEVTEKVLTNLETHGLFKTKTPEEEEAQREDATRRVNGGLVAAAIKEAV